MNSGQVAPGSQASLREANRQRVLDVLREQGALTQVEVAGLTGLSPATVSNVVKDLDATGVVELSPSVRNGRRAVQVSLATGHSLVAAMVFGDRDVRVGIGGSPLEVMGRRRMPLPADHRADEGLERAARLLLAVVEESGKSMTDLRAVCVGVPAPVDLVSGHVGSQDILPGWRGVAVGEAVEDVVQVPVVVENGANLAALGELRSGALQGVENGVYVKLSYGVGAGLILGGDLFRGSTGTAGEIGHVTIDENGPLCRCGNRGCLETYVGSHALLDALRPTHERLTLRDLVAHALDGDAGCRRVLEDAGRHLGVALAGVVNLVNPSVVVLGGELAEVGTIITVPLQTALERCAIPSAAASVRVEVAALGTDADVVGGLVAADLRAPLHEAVAAGLASTR